MQKKLISINLCRVFAALLLCFLLAGCKSPEQRYTEFLYSYMPLPDSLGYSPEYWQANVRKTLEVRERMKWGVSEREFRHFVLPLRVNNENLDDFRTVYADSLCARVQGMSMADAALEINHWCHERATYTPSDGRTLGPMSLIRSGLGRCGEESVLAVSALRAAGIPARQVYTPRWAHTDDNHAWVEVFVDGSWHFMGACEPEPVLDMGWFNSSVSRAMLLHTKVFGAYDGPEDVISRNEVFTEINCIRNYIPYHRSTVRVLDSEGRPVAGARVEFKIYNYAEYYTVACYESDAEGYASLDTGIGDVVVWASRGDDWGLSVVRGEGTVVLDKKTGGEYSFQLEVVPPVEDPLPSAATEQMIQRNNERLAFEDSLRLFMPHPRTQAAELFIAVKDEIDIDPEVIAEIRRQGLTGDEYIDCPRVELEMLRPCRAEIASSGELAGLMNGADVAKWVGENIRVEGVSARNPQGLRIPAQSVWRSRMADAHSRDIFFVAMCRALGYAARLDEASGKPEYRNADGQWIRADFLSAGNSDSASAQAKGHLSLCYEFKKGSAVRYPDYYYHYTLSRIADGTAHLCEFDENAPRRYDYDLDEGYYMLTSGTRMADGSVLSHVETFNLGGGKSKTVDIVLPQSQDKVQVIGSMDGEYLLPYTGRGFYLLCITGQNDEPTIHATGQLTSMASEINEWGRPVVVVGGRKPEGLANMVTIDADAHVFEMIDKGVEYDGKKTLPVIAVADSFGRIVYISCGYNTSMTAQLRHVLTQIK